VIVAVLLAWMAAIGPGVAADYPAVTPGRALAFPRDHGAHPDHRTEWWYVTGWLTTADGRSLGLQVTFFRSRPGIGETNPSVFAPRQLLFGHAAIADPQAGRLLHDERAARAGLGLAWAREDTTDVRIDDWTLALAPGGVRYEARVVARDFAFALAFEATQPILLQGEAGYSRKGPRPGQASYYYSRPHLAVSGDVSLGGQRMPVSGAAWLDHEWSSELMSEDAHGWDWTGLNLDDGASLMAFRMRRADGTSLWQAATLRDADGRVQVIDPASVRFEALRRWRSPRTGAEYPVAVRLHAGGRQWNLVPLFDDQELDARASVGTVYWEGAVRAEEGGRTVGRGYLELTGYWRRLRIH